MGCRLASRAARISATSAASRTVTPSKLAKKICRCVSKMKRWFSGRRNNSARRPMASKRKMRASIKAGGCLISGRKSMRARTSRSTSMPGATSTSSSPSSTNLNTQRSVMNSTGWRRCTASRPLKVRCSTSRTNLVVRPSRNKCSRPLRTATCKPPALKLPTNTTRRALWLMLMNPPAPASRGPNLLTLRLPCASAWARPRKAMSSPPPS